MGTSIKISVDPITLMATIFLEEEDPKVVNALKIICSNLSESYTYKNKRFSLPWFEFRRGLIGIAQVLKRETVNVEFDDLAKKLLQDIVNDKKSIKEKSSSIKIEKEQFEKILLDFNFSRTLKEEQKRDALKLLSLKHGANFSVPGAGKTTTILAVHTVLKKLGLVSKLFVISPINAFISWEDEIFEIFKSKNLTVARLDRRDLQDFSFMTDKNPDVILANYEKLRKDVRQLVPFFLNNKVHLILDESHRVKGGTYNISPTLSSYRF